MAKEPETYSESARGSKITPERAAQEVRKHGLDPEDFFKEVGRRKSYPATKVLRWLGYGVSMVDMPRETYEQGMREASETMFPVRARTKPTRRKA